MKKVLTEEKSLMVIAGGGGFLGSNLAAVFSSYPNLNVVVLDNWSCSDEKLTRDFLEPQGVKVLTYDLLLDQDHSIEEVLTLNGVEFDNIPVFVLNFASIPTPRNYLHRPLLTFNTNVYGTHNLLRFATQVKALYIQASTSEVYGNLDKAADEDAEMCGVNPVNPRACYAESKRAAETLCKIYAQTHSDIDVWILRIFNVYGNRMTDTDGRVIPEFIKNTLRGDRCIINGYRSRCFMHSSDFCRVVEKIVTGSYNRDAVSETNLITINVGNPETHTLREVYEMIHDECEKVVAHPVEKRYTVDENNTTNDDPKFRMPGMSLFNLVFPSFRYRVDLRTGIQRTVRSFYNRSISDSQTH